MSGIAKVCRQCGGAFVATGANKFRQTFCGRQCQYADKKHSERRRAYEARRSARVYDRYPFRDGQYWKTCRCGTQFPLEFNSRKQATSRVLCDACRVVRDNRKGEDLPNIDGIPRCADCGVLASLRFSAVSYLDEAGRCSHCARWFERFGPSPAERRAG